MSLLLTGASGFVGQHAQQQLECTPLADGNDEIDIRCLPKLKEFVADLRPDLVLHLAALSFVPLSFENPQLIIDVNFLGTFNLLRALEASGFKGRMLYVSSGDVYGLSSEAQLPICEDQATRPRNPYAMSKAAAEALCFQWSQTCQFEIIVARPFNHVGPGQDKRFVLPDLASQVLALASRREELELRVGDIEVTRDFTDVRDVVEAYRLLLGHGENGEIYNVCSGIERSIRSIIDLMLAMSNLTCKIEIDPAKVRKNEQRRARGSYSKLNDATGWSPKIPIETSISDLMSYLEREIA